MKRSTVCLVALLGVLLAAVGVAAQAGGDEAGVRKLGEDFTAALNKGDAKAVAALFTKDGDYVSSTGRRAQGRSEIEKLVTDQAGGVFKGTTFATQTTEVRFLKPDVAIGNGTFEASGPMPRKGMTTIVAVREGDNWRIAAIRSMVPASSK
jgi:uncharacterized protein (TIGR02246 family)